MAVHLNTKHISSLEVRRLGVQDHRISPETRDHVLQTPCHYRVVCRTTGAVHECSNKEGTVCLCMCVCVCSEREREEREERENHNMYELRWIIFTMDLESMSGQQLGRLLISVTRHCSIRGFNGKIIVRTPFCVCLPHRTIQWRVEEGLWLDGVWVFWITQETMLS